ncbi:F-box/kelch-repeat protein At3g23880-like [Lycium ferocissimum]|uniref:F-box/kelch-repeat protein At3g23880-like n=1 Tax=Lycium ferocissimum TaxID=112874 RepID=UPI00281574D6|nr:F-box/kelch-repeat protein At3g23880-like [Lycium ferocissimum]
MKKSVANTKRGNLFNQITINDGGIVRCQQQQKKKKSDQICKGKRTSNNSSREQMDIDEPHFKEEIIMEILSKLPVRSILRFKCVSKYWETLMSDPYFKMMHLNHAKNSQKLVISQCCPEGNIFSMYCLPLSSVQPVENVQKLDFPLISTPYRCAIQGSCDGLVIICVNDNIDVERNIRLLWNPSTGESVLLPPPVFSMTGGCRLGFGYDSTSGDYKILKIYPQIDIPGEILALKSSSWRTVDKHHGGICNVISGTHSLPFVNEAFHWIGVSGNYSVVSFSISNEVYGEIPLPQQILCLRGNIYIGVSVLEGLLCVHSSSNHDRNVSFKLWVLKDYGVKESWNALFIIEDPCLFNTIPIYRFEDGEVLFWGINVDCPGHSFRTSRGPFALWPRCDTFQTGTAFTGSLISPKSVI